MSGFQIPDMTTMSRRKGSAEPDYIGGAGAGKQAEARIFFNTGVFWLLGFGVGGAIGIGEGLKQAPNSTWRIRSNSIMNGLSKTGSKMSNTLGLLAFCHTSIIWGCDKLEIDSMTGVEGTSPAIAGGLLGAAYYGTKHGPHAIRIAAASGIGAAVSCAYWVGLPILQSMIPGQGRNSQRRR